MNSLTVVLIFWLAGPNRLESAQWSYHVRVLHQAVERENWYGAERALAFLKSLDRTAYETRRFDLTAARVAARDDRWASVTRRLEDRNWREPWVVLEIARAQEAMGRYGAAIETTFTKGISWSGRDRWEMISLRARCYQALHDLTRAIKAYRGVIGSGVPTDFRIPAYQALLELYYEREDRREARAIAGYLLARQPGSDAALYAVYLLEAHESEAYLNRPSTWRRFADVCYRNRDYKRSDLYYQKIVGARLSRRESDRARYYLARTLAKREMPLPARGAFQRAYPILRDGDFEGPAAFQYLRTLFMTGDDRGVIDFVGRYWQARPRGKWSYENMRLMVLALRRSGDLGAFRDWQLRLERDGAPQWLMRFYHRNGLVWAMSEKRTENARYYLDAYRRYGLNRNEKQEARLWEGLIHWESGAREEALTCWMSIVLREPNHFFGLVARDMIRGGSERTGIGNRRWEVVLDRLDSLPLARLKELYFLMVRPDRRARIAALLTRHLPQFTFDAPLEKDSRAAKMARIGRFDLAARLLERRDTSNLTYHYLKASWYRGEGDLYRSIKHAEILVKAYPKWTPYELLPLPLQRLAYPEGFSDIIHDKAATYNVDPYLLLAIIREESHFNTRAKSWASARGLMQFIPQTAREVAEEVEEIGPFSLPMLYDPRTSITLGARYIDKLMRTFDGVSLYTVAAYNAGEGAVNRWRELNGRGDLIFFVGDVTYNETKFYCQKVLRAYHHYMRVYENQDPQSFVSEVIPGVTSGL